MKPKKVSWGPSGIWYKIVRSQTAITRSQTAICDLVSGRYFVGKVVIFSFKLLWHHQVSMMSIYALTLPIEHV